MSKSNESQKPLGLDLRTRIAAAIMDSCHGVFMDDAVHAADAVIRELGLPPTWGKPSFENGRTDQVETPTRYVTECTENG